MQVIWQELNLSQLVPAAWDYKIPDKKLQGKLVSNIKRNGLIVNFIVSPLGDGNYEVIDGKSRLEAAKTANITKAMCCILEGISQVDAKRIAAQISENHFENDNEKLNKIIANVLGKFDDAKETLPFTEGHLAEAIGKVVPSDPTKDRDKSKITDKPDRDLPENKKVIMHISDTLYVRWCQYLDDFESPKVALENLLTLIEDN